MSDKEHCINWMNFEAIRKTVTEYEKRWGANDEPLTELSDFQITQNCMECNMRPELPQSVETLAQISELFKTPVLKELEGVGMKRKCFKPMEDFKHGDKVRYIPNHANGDAKHPDCQNGIVSSVNDNWVFVKYDCLACTMCTGDEPYTAQATKRENLIMRL